MGGPKGGGRQEWEATGQLKREGLSEGVASLCTHSALTTGGSGSGEQPACSGGPGCNGLEKLC